MIMPKRITKQSGFTIIELMMTILIASVAILGISGVLADSYKGYNRMFTRVHGNIVVDAYVARLKFDKICRMARAGSATVDTTVPFLRVEYYSAPNLGANPNLGPDMFAKFSLSGTNFVVTTGAIGTAGNQEIIANNVNQLKFSAPVDGKTVQMVMTLADTNHAITVTCGSIMHN